MKGLAINRLKIVECKNKYTASNHNGYLVTTKVNCSSKELFKCELTNRAKLYGKIKYTIRNINVWSASIRKK